MNEQVQEQVDARRQLLKDFIHAVEQMRHFQTVYFKNRLSGDLQKSKQWEREVDRLLEKIRNRQSATPVQRALL